MPWHDPAKLYDAVGLCNGVTLDNAHEMCKTKKPAHDEPAFNIF
jgi:hypothetical protein